MARIKRAVNAVKKRRKVFKLSKGYYGAKSKQYRAASQQVMRSMAYAYVGRKLKKREYRKLWIARINAGARICGTTLQPHDRRPEEGWRGCEPQGSGRSRRKRYGGLQEAGRYRCRGKGLISLNKIAQSETAALFD